MEFIMEAFHTRLRRLRKMRGLSMSALSREIGIPPSTYRDWEYGAAILGQPYIKLAAALNVSLYQLLGSEKSENQNLLDLLDKLDSTIKELKKEVLPLI